VSVEEIVQPQEDSAFANQAEELELMMQQRQQQRVQSAIQENEPVPMGGGQVEENDQPEVDSAFADQAE
jgi:hypothetical protein